MRLIDADKLRAMMREEIENAEKMIVDIKDGFHVARNYRNQMSIFCFHFQIIPV